MLEGKHSLEGMDCSTGQALRNLSVVCQSKKLVGAYFVLNFIVLKVAPFES